MKYFFVVLMIAMYWSCSGNTTNSTTVDTMNGINNRPLDDTVVAPRNNGYAPPNATVDTSKGKKDSIKARDSEK